MAIASHHLRSGLTSLVSGKALRSQDSVRLGDGAYKAGGLIVGEPYRMRGNIIQTIAADGSHGDMVGELANAQHNLADRALDGVEASIRNSTEWLESLAKRLESHV